MGPGQPLLRFLQPHPRAGDHRGPWRIWAFRALPRRRTSLARKPRFWRYSRSSRLRPVRLTAFQTLRSIQLDVESLWAPILTATSYYLAATVVFPTSATDLDHLDDYFAERKRFAIGFLFVCEMLGHLYFQEHHLRGCGPASAGISIFSCPFTSFSRDLSIALFFSKSKRANIFWLSVLILLLLFVYWDHGTIAQMINKAYAQALSPSPWSPARRPGSASSSRGSCPRAAIGWCSRPGARSGSTRWQMSSAMPARSRSTCRNRRRSDADGRR